MNDKTDSYNVTAEADQAHDDKWLADAVVTLGVGSERGGYYSHLGSGFLSETQNAPPWFVRTNQTVDTFVRDWQVAGPLIVRVIEECTYDDIQPHPDPSDSVARDFMAKCVSVLNAIRAGQEETNA